MNILFLLRNWPSFGGGETVTKCLANELIKRGHRVGVAYFKKTLKEGDSISPDCRILAYHLEAISFDETSSEYNIKKSVVVQVQKLILDIVLQENYDIIVNQWWPVEFLESLKTKSNAKIIKCLHMDPDTKKVFTGMGFKGKLYSTFEPLYRWVESKKHLYECDKYLNNSDLFVFLAPSFSKNYLNKTSIKDAGEKVDYVYNPLVFKSQFCNDDFKHKAKVVLVVGRLLEKHKKISRILSVWKKIECLHEDWKLQIVGDGPDKGKYEEMVSDLGLCHVSFEGYQNPLPYYRKASIFLMTSAYEGFPMTVIESLQNGVVPVVMNTFSSINDIIECGVNGYVTSDREEDFIQPILSLIENRDKRLQLARRGLESCQIYSVENIVEKWERIFSKLKD